MRLWLLLWGCQEELSPPPKTLRQPPPIFVDMNNQNWNYPSSSIMSDLPQNTDPILQKANIYYHEEAYLKAAELLIPYLEQHPQDVIGHSILGAAFFRLKDMTQAEKAARNALKYEESTIIYSNLGSILLGKGDIKGAIEAYEKARLLDPKHFLPIRNLVTLYYKSRNLPLAEELLYELIKIDPSDSYGYVSLGQVLVEQEKWSEAEALYRFRLLDLQNTPKEERYLAGGLMLDLPLALGRVLLHQKKYKKSEEAFLYTLQLSTKVQSTWAPRSDYQRYAYEGLLSIYKVEGKTEKYRAIQKQLEGL